MLKNVIGLFLEKIKGREILYTNEKYRKTLFF